MKKVFAVLIISVLVLSVQLYAQSPFNKMSRQLKDAVSSQESDKYLTWIFFTDKGNELQKYFQKPASVVTERSLERRKKVMPAGELITYADLPVKSEYIEAIESAGVKIRNITRWFNGVSACLTAEQIDRVTAFDFVRELDAVTVFRKKYDILSEKPEKYKTVIQPAGVHILDYGASYIQNQLINTPALHDKGLSGSGVLIAIMDTETTQLTHECFAELEIVATRDFVGMDNDVTDGSHPHGTSTLSAIGGYLPGKLIGTAYGASFLIAHTENINSETNAEEDNWVAAIEWADSLGADISTTSLGYLGMDEGYTSYTWEDMDGNTTIITRAADLAVARGISVFNSAGNNGLHISHNTLSAPADGDSVIAVGSVYSDTTRISFSSVGNTVDGRIKPDIMALGTGVYSADTDSDEDYRYGSGTSMSCPLAAGIAALLLQYDPELTPMEIREALRNTASNSDSPDRFTGWGLADALAAYNYLFTDSINGEELINGYKLENNYPNPFNPGTAISFYLPRAGQSSLVIYNTLGRKVAVLVEGFLNEGQYSYTFNSEGLAAGVYIARLRSGEFTDNIKMMLVK